jgi:hypothetical protein
MDESGQTIDSNKGIVCGVPLCDSVFSVVKGKSNYRVAPGKNEKQKPRHRVQRPKSTIYAGNQT